MKHSLSFSLLLIAGVVAGTLQAAEPPVVNIYSARQEVVIKPLLDRFSAGSGIRTRLVTAKAGPAGYPANAPRCPIPVE